MSISQTSAVTPVSVPFTVPPVPSYARSRTVIAAPGRGKGNWAGAPSAVLVDGTFWLAYRLRRPVDEGRGVAVVLARSQDGEHFETVGSVGRDAFGAASLERPALVPLPDGGWRLYVSCATPGSKHWWIDALDADEVTGLPAAPRRTVLPGDATLAVKDPVVQVDDAGWRMWVCCHPLSEPGAEDRMTTRLATSDDGLDWTMGPEVLVPTPGTWDQRGTRISAVFDTVVPTALYDGRATAQDNWYERTGLAQALPDGTFAAVTAEPSAQAPHGTSALRYACVVPLPAGGHRLYYEASTQDGAHDLRTEVVS